MTLFPPSRRHVSPARPLLAASVLLLLAVSLTVAFFVWRGYRRPVVTASTTHAPYPAGQDWGSVADPARSVWPAGGAPRARDESLLLLLHNAAYTVGFSARRGAPLWSSVRLFWPPPADLGLRQGRPGTFEPDFRLPEALRATSRQWVRSGFDRGHLTPNAAVADLYGREAQLETFLLSNVCLQSPHLNRGAWERLERVAATDYARRYGEVWVMYGPIFSPSPEHLEGDPPVPIPRAFWKVIVAPHGPRGPPAALGFVMAQDTPEGDALKGHLTSVAKIETAAGLDLFPELNTALATALRGPAPMQRW